MPKFSIQQILKLTTIVALLGALTRLVDYYFLYSLLLVFWLITPTLYLLVFRGQSEARLLILAVLGTVTILGLPLPFFDIVQLLPGISQLTYFALLVWASQWLIFGMLVHAVQMGREAHRRAIESTTAKNDGVSQQLSAPAQQHNRDGVAERFA